MASWLSTAIQNVRDKSMEAIDFVRRDLNEFKTTIKSDAETYLNKIKSQEVGDLGINQFVSKFSDSHKTDNPDEKHFQASASFDRVRTELNRIQNDESTYLNDPTPIETYQNWCETTNFNVDTRKGEIAQLLIDAPNVRSIYAHLVPAQTTHSDFWSRYYYRVHLIEEEEARRTQLIRRAHEICTESNDTTGRNTEIDWDEIDDDAVPEELAAPLSTAAILASSVTENPIPIEHQDSPEQQQETKIIESEIATEKSGSERTESDTVSGDSWEREFDETDTSSSIPPIDPLTKSEETVTSDSLTSSTTAQALPSSSSSNKKGENQSDDEWESWT